MGKRHIIGWTAAIFLIASVLLPGLHLEVEASEISDFDNYVTSIEELSVPEGTRIIALGEATHGNREFQQLKREVFEILVRKYDVRALVIEGDCGGCTIINEYIQGGEGDDRELTKLLGYRLYRTDDMQELIRWMHDYNETAPEEGKVRLYGMDIQRSTFNIQVLKAFYDQVDPERAADVSGQLDDLFGTEEDGYDKERVDEIIASMDALSEELENHSEAYIEASDPDTYLRACLSAQALSCYIRYGEKENYSHRYRDESMKSMVDRILAHEELEHGSELLLRPLVGE